jgi:predicted restriction endonuclease
VYRANLERVEKRCRVTDLDELVHLRASHIKHWCKCADEEKLDGFNGLLLSPHVDHLFDRGYISFSDAGDLLISESTTPAVLMRWGIVLPRNVGQFRPEQCKYLEYHRRRVFKS